MSLLRGGDTDSDPQLRQGSTSVCAENASPALLKFEAHLHGRSCNVDGLTKECTLYRSHLCDLLP